MTEWFVMGVAFLLGLTVGASVTLWVSWMAWNLKELETW